MRAHQVVPRNQVGAEPGGDGFLTYVDVCRTGDRAPAVLVHDLFLEPPHQKHRSVEVQQPLAALDRDFLPVQAECNPLPRLAPNRII